jgi:hypothetical protein
MAGFDSVLSNWATGYNSDGYSSGNPFDRQIGVKTTVLADLKENALYSILRTLYDTSFQPSISGYNIIYLISPDFSSTDSHILSPFSYFGSFQYLNKVPLLATDFTPPDIQVNSVNVNLSSSATMTLPTGINRGGVLNITYLDTNQLQLYSFHEYWVKYIDSITGGKISPAESYYKQADNRENICEIDYVGAAIIAKFDPTMTNLLHIGKAVGIFPVSQPVKEILGTRGSYELVNIPVTYNCMAYLTATSTDFDPTLYNELKEEFLAKLTNSE